MKLITKIIHKNECQIESIYLKYENCRKKMFFLVKFFSLLFLFNKTDLLSYLMNCLVWLDLSVIPNLCFVLGNGQVWVKSGFSLAQLKVELKLWNGINLTQFYLILTLIRRLTNI